MRKSGHHRSILSLSGRGERSMKALTASRGCQALLGQCISPWNGALYTRQQLFQQLRAEGKTDAFIDFWVFHPDALTEAEIQTKYARGELINDIPNTFPDWYVAAME